MQHSRDVPYHSRTQGKVERWHQALKSRILQGNHLLPRGLEARIATFIDHDNHQLDTLNTLAVQTALGSGNPGLRNFQCWQGLQWPEPALRTNAFLGATGAVNVRRQEGSPRDCASLPTAATGDARRPDIGLAFVPRAARKREAQEPPPRSPATPAATPSASSLKTDSRPGQG